MFRFNSKIQRVFTAALLVFSATAGGCGRRDREAGEAKTEGQPQYLMVKGSDTMVHLVSAWAEAYMKAAPNVEVSVTGGGSGTGIAALLNGTTDICAASRKMNEKEYDLAKEKGMEPKEFVVARDGIAVVVNPSNPVSELSVEKTGKIFTGAYTNWRQLGGPDAEIIVLSRESSSGTYVFFQEHVLNKKDYTPQARLMPATSSIIQSVSSDKWAIGYVGLGYALEAGDKVKMLSIKADENSPAVVPSESTVVSGEYSISRPLHLYTAGRPQAVAKQFIDFCLGLEGQEIVRQTGYIAVQ